MQLAFANGSAELTPEAKDRIAEFARTINGEPKLTTASFRVDGFTSAVGSRASNLELSRQRAAAVADYMASLGVARDHLEASGHGFDSPLPGHGPAEAANRRVEIIKK